MENSRFIDCTGQHDNVQRGIRKCDAENMKLIKDIFIIECECICKRNQNAMETNAT